MLQHRPSGGFGVWRTGWRGEAPLVAMTAVAGPRPACSGTTAAHAASAGWVKWQRLPSNGQGGADGDVCRPGPRRCPGTRSAVGNPPCQLDLIVGGSSEDAFCSPDFIVRVANPLGKCQDKVQAACIICVIPRIGMTGSGL